MKLSLFSISLKVHKV